MGKGASSVIGASAVAIVLLLVLSVGAVATALIARPTLDQWPHMSARRGADGLSVRFIGTSGFIIRDGDVTLVLDGFISRPPLETVMFGDLVPGRAQLQQVMERTDTDTIRAVMVAHSHYDHAMDAASWVKMAGGKVMGTASTVAIARAEGVYAVDEVGPFDQRRIGPFALTVFGLDHAAKERMAGVIDEDFTVPAHARSYRSGGGLGVYIQHPACRILWVPSAGRPHVDLSDYPADVVLLSVGQLGLKDAAHIRRYWQQTVVASGARRVIPIHWDDFTRPLDQPLKALPYAVERVDVSLREIMILAGDEITVALPVLYEPLDLSASGRC